MLIKGSLPFGKTISRVLIVQLGDIGDVVSATPAFRAVWASYPQAVLALLVRENSAAFSRMIPISTGSSR